MYVGPPPNVFVCGLHRSAQINSHYRSTPSRHYIGETSHTTSRIKDHPPRHLLEPKPNFRRKPGLRVILSQTIQLRTAEQIPLPAKVRGITVASKSRNIVVDGVRAACAA